MAKGFILKRSTGQWFRAGNVEVCVKEIRRGQVFLQVSAPGQLVERGEIIDANGGPPIGSAGEQGNNSQEAP